MRVWLCWENCEQYVKVFDSLSKATEWVENEDRDGRTGCGCEEMEVE